MKSRLVIVALSLLVASCDQGKDANAQQSSNKQAMATKAEASPQGEVLPAIVRKWLDEQQAQCKSEGNVYKGVGEAIREFEFNGDGVKDFALWEGGIKCEGRPISWFGNAGGQLSFAISSGGAYKILDGFAIADWDFLKIEKQSQRDILVVSDGEREGAWAWNGSKMALSMRSDLLSCTFESEGGSGEFQIAISQISQKGGGRWSGKASVLPRKDFPEYPKSMDAVGTKNTIQIAQGQVESISLDKVDGEWQGSLDSVIDGEEIYRISASCN